MARKLLVFGNEFSRAHTSDQTPYPETLATALGLELDNRVSDMSTNFYIWETIAQEIRTGQLNKTDYIVVQYNNMFEKHFYSLERSSDFNDLSSKDQKTFDFREEMGVMQEAKMSMFTKWSPGASDQQHHALDKELHFAYEQAVWDGRDCLWHFNNTFFNYHFMTVNMLKALGINARFVISSPHVNPLSDEQLTAETKDCGFSINDWLGEFNPNERKKIISDEFILSKRGHNELALSLYSSFTTSQ